jgi:SNF2 family DNA or RNA helicase
MILDTILYPYQQKCLKWMLKRERSKEAPGGFLCLEMGLGKTILTMATMVHNPVGKTLIIMPANLVTQWKSEFEKFTDCEPFVIDATSSNKGLITSDVLEAHSVFLAPISVFGAMRNADENSILTYEFDRIVVDEAHLLRNHKTKSYRLIRQLGSRIKWCLTGTPVVKDDRNFTTLLEFLGIFKVNLKYAAREYMYRLVKEDMLLDLPKLIIEDLRADFQTQLEKDIYADIITDGQTTVKAYKAYSDAEGRMEILKTLLRLRQCTANISMVPKDDADGEFYEGPSTKLQMLEQDIASSPNQKTLVFAHFHKEMDAIKKMLLSHGHRVMTLSGKKSAEERTTAIDTFTNDPTVNFFIIQVDAGGVGLNLQAASRIYMNGVHWNGTSELQAIARAHRIGQTRPVTVKRLIINDSIDDSIIQIQQRKFAAAAELLGDERIKHSLKAGKKNSEFKSLIASVFSS